MHNLTPALFRLRCSDALLVIIAAISLFAAAVPVFAADGAQVYAMRCASCHGATGEGSDEYPHALAGDRTKPQLASFIARTMPKNAKDKCPPDEAALVGAYIYDAFYSREAQARLKPARVELSRLTVRQYRSAIADLIESFHSPGRWDEQHGLRGEYFNSRQFQTQARKLDRIDGTVQFEFGDSIPIPETPLTPEAIKKAEAEKKADDKKKNTKPQPKFKEFAIRWQGSVLAPESGDYEFIVKTENAVRLWVNDNARALIDAGVKSGNDKEYRGTIRLLGGRVYPLRLEFTKANEPTASIALWWKPPGRAAEPVPARYLTPARFPESYVVAAAFPPDDRSTGYERGTSISKAWDQATTEAAIEIAGEVAANWRQLAGQRGDGDDPAARAFCRRFAERAFRRPLTEEQKKLFIDRQFDAVRDPDGAVKRVVLLVLKSPRFLYRELGGDDAHAVASRLSFTLWDTEPDTELTRAAASGQLATRAQAARQAERMMADVRARAKLREFFRQWLKVDQTPELAKDRKQFPDFDEAVASDLRTSLDLFLDDVIWSPASDWRQLLLADYLFLNGRLARLYGASLPADAPFLKVGLEPGLRAGILTHPYLMAYFAYPAASSPIHRGVFLSRNVLGVALRPPPEAFVPLPAELHPELSTRERVLLQTKPQACQSCHSIINPLGFTLEQFDALGRYREQDQGKRIDASGAYVTRGGAVVKFSGVRDLAVYLAASDEAQAAFVERLFQYMVKQPIRAFGPRRLEELREFFAKNDFNVRKLVIEIATVAALKEEQRESP